jgi:hypothetical protein
MAEKGVWIEVMLVEDKYCSNATAARYDDARQANSSEKGTFIGYLMTQQRH